MFSASDGVGRSGGGRAGSTDEVDFDGVAFAFDAYLSATLRVVSRRNQRLRRPFRTLQQIFNDLLEHIYDSKLCFDIWRATNADY